MTKQEYIEKTVSGIKDRAEREDAAREISEHIDELTDLWRLRGLDETAEERAVEEMGAPEAAGEALGELHSGRFLSAAGILTALMYLLLSVGLMIFWRYAFLLFSPFYETPLSCLVEEAVLFCLCAFPLLFGVRRKSPLLCFAAALHSLVLCAVCSWEMFGELSSPTYDAHTFVSPGLMAAAVAVSGRHDVFGTYPSESVCARSPVVFALTVLLYALIPVSSVLLTVLYAKKRTRYGRKAKRVGKAVRRCLSYVCPILLIVNVSFEVFLLPKNSAADVMRYDGWYAIQTDEMFPLSEIFLRIDGRTFEDSAFFETEYMFGPWGLFSDHYTNYALAYGEDSSPAARVRDRVPGLLDLYEYSIRETILREKRYLLAVPVYGGVKDIENAAWYDLDAGSTVRLRFSNDPHEYSYLDLTVTER